MIKTRHLFRQRNRHFHVPGTSRLYVGEIICKKGGKRKPTIPARPPRKCTSVRRRRWNPALWNARSTRTVGSAAVPPRPPSSSNRLATSPGLNMPCSGGGRAEVCGSSLIIGRRGFDVVGIPLLEGGRCPLSKIQPATFVELHHTAKLACNSWCCNDLKITFLKVVN